MEAVWEFIRNTVPPIAEGLVVTLQVFAWTIVLSLPLGFVTALLRISRFAPLRAVTGAWIYVLRGTPLLLQVFFVYYALPAIGVTFNNFVAAVIAFVLNYSVYFAEIFRAGIQSVDKGQYEAAKALGLNPIQTMFYVVIPQMVRLVLPPVGNETITLVKDTALVSIVALSDIMRVTKTRVASTGSVMPFLVAAIFYLALTFILSVFFTKLEKKLNYIQEE